MQQNTNNIQVTMADMMEYLKSDPAAQLKVTVLALSRRNRELEEETLVGVERLDKMELDYTNALEDLARVKPTQDGTLAKAERVPVP
jgi:hypothetical protein